MRAHWDWFCYGKCQEFVELNTDREQNVCAQCGQPTVSRRPVHADTREYTRAERKERRSCASALAMCDRDRAHAMFDEMRKAAA